MHRVIAHLSMVAFTGTANHLIERHGLTEDQIDRDDGHGLLADHFYLHGVRLDAKGNPRADDLAATAQDGWLPSRVDLATATRRARRSIAAAMR